MSAGGGSTTGLGKAIASRTGLPHPVLPTTYAGSEVTPVLGETAGGQKVTRSGPEILPDTVVCDVDLTLTLPWAMTVTSAVNAMAHAVEALYSPDRTTESDQLSTDAIAALARGLRTLQSDPDSVDARSDLLYGAWLAGTCLGTVGMGLHHELCHTLGAASGSPTPRPTPSCCRTPWSTTRCRSRGDAGCRRSARGRGRSIRAPAAGGVPGGPTSLAELGFRHADLARASELATARPYPNPREVTRDGITDLLTRATDGTPIGENA